MIWNFLKRRRKPAYPAEAEAPRAKAPAAAQLPRTRLRDATLVITHAEVCDRHGTGALLGKIFEHERALLYSIPETFSIIRAEALSPITSLTRRPSSRSSNARWQPFSTVMRLSASCAFRFTRMTLSPPLLQRSLRALRW